MTYEIHITIPVSSLTKKEKRILRQQIPFGTWQVSNITDDPYYGEGDRYYLTDHQETYEVAFQSMDIMWATLLEAGYKPCRKKIEHEVYDFKLKEN
jgi:hypothetical protein